MNNELYELLNDIGIAQFINIQRLLCLVNVVWMQKEILMQELADVGNEDEKFFFHSLLGANFAFSTAN